MRYPSTETEVLSCRSSAAWQVSSVDLELGSMVRVAMYPQLHQLLHIRDGGRPRSAIRIEGHHQKGLPCGMTEWPQKIDCIDFHMSFLSLFRAAPLIISSRSPSCLSFLRRAGCMLQSIASSKAIDTGVVAAPIERCLAS